MPIHIARPLRPVVSTTPSTSPSPLWDSTSTGYCDGRPEPVALFRDKGGLSCNSGAMTGASGQ